jgi:hypothetical protein
LCCPSHNMGLVVHILGLHYRPKMCITGPKVCNGQYQNVSEHLQSPDTSWTSKWAIREKKEVGSNFVLPAIMNHSFLLSSSPTLSSSHYHTSIWDNPKQLANVTPPRGLQIANPSICY